MTADGTASNGAGEAPKAELSPGKGAVTAAPLAEKPAEEREGVGGPFVIVNGDSDGHSDRGSDTGAGPEADSASDEGDLPRTNAGPDADTGRDHGPAGAELDATVDFSSTNGHGPSAVESEDGVGGGKAGESKISEAGLGEQETAGGELGGEDAPAKLEIEHADPVVDSAASSVDSVAKSKENEMGKSAATDVAELPVHEAASEEQHDGTNSAAESNGPDNAPTYANSGSIVLDSEVCGEESKGEVIATESMELGTDESEFLVVNGQHDAGISSDSSITATHSLIHAEEGKHQQAYPNVTEVEQEATYGEQDVTDALQGNGHDPEVSADSCASASEFKAPANKSEGQQVESLTDKVEVSDAMLDASSSDCRTCTSKEPIEEEVVANGHGHAEDSADTSGKLEPGVDEEEGEATRDVISEDIITMDSKENLHGLTSTVGSTDEEAKLPMKEEMHEDAPAKLEMCAIAGNKSEQLVQDDQLVKDDVSVGILHSVKPELDPVVEPNWDQRIQVEVAADDENTAVPDVKAVKVETNTADNVEAHNLRSAFEDRSIQLHVNSSGEVDEEVKKQACPEEVHLAQNDSSAQTGKHEQLELPGAGVADKGDHVVVEAEPREEAELEVVDSVPLCAPAASTFHDEPRSIALDDNDRVKHSSPGTELESCDDIQPEECGSQEISSSIVDEVTSGASMEHGTAVTSGVELTNESGDASLEISSGTAADQGEPVALSENKAIEVDNVKPSPATVDESAVVGEASDISPTDGPSHFVADCQPHHDQPEICHTSTACKQLVSSIEDPRPSGVTLESGVKSPFTDKETPPSDEACKDICYGTINSSNKSSQVVEAKSLEALGPLSVDTIVPEEHKNDDEHANNDEEKIVKDFTDAPVDLNKSDKGDIHTIRPPKCFMIKVPKFAGDDVWERIQDAQVHLDRLTQERDAINVRKKKQKAICDEYRGKLEAARQQESEARAALGDKRNNLDNVRSVLAKMNKATTVDDIDERIAWKENVMVHETISLKDEKRYIKEINELKTQRKQLCSNMGSKAEISEAFDQQDHIHEQHKTLKKDSDALFKNLKSLEENKRKIQKYYEEERLVLGKLNAELQAANERRQMAYDDWVELRAEPGKKNKYFFMYKRDRAAVNNFMQMNDVDGLQSYCNNQVEGFLEIWNKDDDFRKLYVEANQASTVRRLGTLDGRSLNFGEEPPVIRSRNFNRRSTNPSPLTVSSPNVPIITSEAVPEKPVPAVVLEEEDTFPVLPPPQIHKQAKSKAAGSSSQKEIITAPASEMEDVKHIENEKARLMEELELARKAEELARREEELKVQRAAAEKERLRLEQKAKAKEAEERKKKKAEKAQERAEFKARKEAEMKEKKKAKKDKKIGTTPEDLVSGLGEGNSAAITTADTESNGSESARDTEVPPQAAPRRIARPAAAMRQLNRLQPMPLPLRNRSRRRTRQYIIIGAVVALVAAALILAARYLNLPGLSLLRF